jgi:hypothetical protein
MTPTHTPGLPPLVTLRIGDAAAYRTGEEAADRKTATNKGTSGTVAGSNASEVPQGDASAATRTASSTDGQAAQCPRSTIHKNDHSQILL